MYRTINEYEFKQAFKDMFGALDIDKELYFKRLEEIANQNLMLKM